MRTAHRAHFVFKTQNNINKFTVTTIADCKSTYTQWRHECISHIFTLHLLRLLPACHRMDICEIFIYIQHTSPLLIRLVSARARTIDFIHKQNHKIAIFYTPFSLWCQDAYIFIYMYNILLFAHLYNCNNLLPIELCVLTHTQSHRYTHPSDQFFTKFICIK